MGRVRDYRSRIEGKVGPKSITIRKNPGLKSRISPISRRSKFYSNSLLKERVLSQVPSKFQNGDQRDPPLALSSGGIERAMALRKLLAIVFFLTFAACAEESEEAKRLAKDPSAKLGRIVYLLNCTACHNRNPAKAGSQGPPIKGSSRTLLEAKILHASYPPGYVPKRTSNAMRRYPHLEKKISQIAAYLR